MIWDIRKMNKRSDVTTECVRGESECDESERAREQRAQQQINKVQIISG